MPRALPTRDHSFTVEEACSPLPAFFRTAPEMANQRDEIFKGEGKNPGLHSSRKITNSRRKLNESNT